ncbi:hypothetical protein [Dactylosporangium sp. CA-233914]|uniref:hypothetical protein n=1 Tax=Dactylosporangium sp. CA-233914 TaxID=3239934 RepID=UPI003D9356BD
MVSAASANTARWAAGTLPTGPMTSIVRFIPAASRQLCRSTSACVAAAHDGAVPATGGSQHV